MANSNSAASSHQRQVPVCPVHGRHHTVFLSYRRSDGEDLTSHIFHTLKGRKTVAFFDLQCLGPGEFSSRLERFASRADVLAPILTPDYVKYENKIWKLSNDYESSEECDAVVLKGSERNNIDYCRLELYQALRYGKPIIPIVKLLQKAEIFNIAGTLPDDDPVKEALKRNICFIGNASWDDDVDRFVLWMKELSSGLTGEIMNGRCFKNTFPDYDDLTEGQIHDIQSQLHTFLDNEIPRLVEEILPTIGPYAVRSTGRLTKQSDYTLYTGVAGQSLALLHAYHHFRSVEHGSDSLSKKCEDGYMEALNLALDLAGQERYLEYSFYCGVSGVYALACMVHGYSNPKLASFYAQRVVDATPNALLMEDTELLCGQAGFLYCLLIVQKNCPPALWPSNLHQACEKVFNSIIQRGLKDASRVQNQYPTSRIAQGPLAFPFKGSVYVGAGHGLAGVLYVLLHLHEMCLTKTCKPVIIGALDSLLSAQNSEGNFYSSVRSHDSDLTHWCHGAPGVIPTLCKAYSVFGEPRFLDSAKRAADWVWQRGLLKKGVGVCHGISGSSLSLLTLYRNTGSRRYLYRAMVMLQACWHETCLEAIRRTPDPQRRVNGIPDHPYSLMEGKAGLLYAYVSVMRPDSSSFPGYDGAT